MWREMSGAPLQAVYREAPIHIAEEDWRGQESGPDRIAAAAARERDAELELSKPPLQRVRLIRLADDRHRLIWTYHHILMDGWSSARFIVEVLDDYYGAPSPAEPAHYRNYIAWLAARDAQAAERYWRDQLKAFDAPTLLAAAFGSRQRQDIGPWALLSAIRRSADVGAQGLRPPRAGDAEHRHSGGLGLVAPALHRPVERHLRRHRRGPPG